MFQKPQPQFSIYTAPALQCGFSGCERFFSSSNISMSSYNTCKDNPHHSEECQHRFMNTNTNTQRKIDKSLAKVSVSFCEFMRFCFCKSKIEKALKEAVFVAYMNMKRIRFYVEQMD